MGCCSLACSHANMQELARRPLTCRVPVQVRESHRAMLADHHACFHSTWGQLLKTGYQNSRFAHQVSPVGCVHEHCPLASLLQ